MQAERDKRRDTHRTREKLAPIDIQEYQDYPVWKHKDDIANAVMNFDNVIISGGTGSGKTTLIYEILRSQMESSKAILTQPRIKATVNTAIRVAQIAGSRLGNLVGYHHRGKARESEKTQMIFTTDGSLKSMIEQDPLLTDFNYVIVDEVHERSANIDTLLALLLKAQELRKGKLKPLKIIAMSATADTDELAHYLPGSKVVEVEGKLHEVKEFYSDIPITAEKMPQTAAAIAFEKILLNVQKKDGDLLIFMPGKREIRDTESELLKQFESAKKKEGLPRLIELGIADKEGNLNIEIIQYHAKQNEKILNDAMRKSKMRKIIIATNAAQTSLTIPNLIYVIDSGLAKQKFFDVRTGIESLKLIPAAQSSLKQRRGRAGRLKDGEGHALFTKKDYEGRPAQEIPEIQRTNLLDFVLTLKKRGIHQLSELKLISTPPDAHLAYAIRTLREWGALDKSDKLTLEGEIMAELGVDPRYAYLVLQGRKYGCVTEACQIAAFLSINKDQSILPDNEAFKVDNESDFHSILRFWQELIKNKGSSAWLEAHNLRDITIENLENTYDDLIETLKEQGVTISKASTFAAVDKAVTATYLDRLLVYDPHSGTYHSMDSPLSNIRPDKWNSVLVGQTHPLITIGDEIGSEQKVSFAKLAHRVDLNLLLDIAPERFTKESLPLKYDQARDHVVQPFRNKLHHTSLYTDTFQDFTGNNKEAAGVFIQALATEHISHSLIQDNQNAVASINLSRRQQEYEKTPKFTKEKLVEFYTKRLDNIASLKELDDAIKTKGLNISINPQDFLVFTPIPTEQRTQETPHTGTVPITESFTDKIKNLVSRFRNWLRKFFSG